MEVEDDVDMEAAEIFSKAVGGSRARALFLKPHGSKSAPLAQQNKDTLEEIHRRDTKKHADLPLPVKMMRELMQQGLVADPQFDRDCNGLTQEESQAKDQERLKNHRLYKPEWVPRVRLWSDDIKDAIERGCLSGVILGSCNLAQ
jgi:hypothetical protein